MEIEKNKLLLCRTSKALLALDVSQLTTSSCQAESRQPPNRADTHCKE